MGTRSITKVFDDSGTCVAAIYKQHDGYPSGLGVKLRDFLGPMKVINGLSGQKAPAFANGAGCLAAQLISRLKDGQIGGVYMTNADCEREDFGYDLHVTPGKPVRLHLTDSSGETLYDGPIKDFKPEDD